MKILYVTTIGMTMGFFKSFIKKLSDDGNEVELACNCSLKDVPEFYINNGFKIHGIDCSRTPLNKGNLKAVKQLKKIVENEHFDIVHCHTPIAAACCRIACRKARKNGTKVIYTAHGFHFYKGAPLTNWLIYYPIEKICSYFTDVLITINTEDYAFALRKLKAKDIKYVPGVGINKSRFSDADVNKNEKRRLLGIPEEAFLILSVGELNENKNHETVIRAVAELADKKIHYAIAGGGGRGKYLQELAKELKVEDRIHLLGQRTDIEEIYKSADIYVLPSIREGLNVSVMEAMASGLPVIASDIRGNRDMVMPQGGFLVSPTNVSEFADVISKLLNDDEMRKEMSEFNFRKSEEYAVKKINSLMLDIYNA